MQARDRAFEGRITLNNAHIVEASHGTSAEGNDASTILRARLSPVSHAQTVNDGATHVAGAITTLHLQRNGPGSHSM